MTDDIQTEQLDEVLTELDKRLEELKELESAELTDTEE